MVTKIKWKQNISAWFSSLFKIYGPLGLILNVKDTTFHYSNLRAFSTYYVVDFPLPTNSVYALPPYPSTNTPCTHTLNR